MDTSTVLIVAALACPIAMGLMMWLMNTNMNGESHPPMSGMDADRLDALRKQKQTLDQEIAEVQKIMDLEEKKKTLARIAAMDSPSDSQSRSS